MLGRKQRYFKKMMAVVLSVLLLVSQLPMSVFAIETVEEEVTAPTNALTLGSSVTVTEKTLYSFVPEEDGVYYFYSQYEDIADPKMRLLDESKNLLEKADDTSMDNNFELRYTLTGGTTYYVEADAFDNQFPYTLWVVESEIANVEIVSVPTFVTEEYSFDYGMWDDIYESELVEPYFIYEPFDAVYQAVIKVTYRNGETEELSYFDENDYRTGISYEWDFYQNPWKVGTDNHYYITYKGFKLLADATVTASPVKSIELISTELPVFTEYDESIGGWTDYYKAIELDEKFFYYSLQPLASSIKLKVTYHDETSEEISYFNEETKKFAGIMLTETQYKKPWTVGSENEFTIWYRGASVTANATVVKSDVQSIRVLRGGDYAFAEFDQSCGYWINQFEGKFYYYDQKITENLVLEVIYTNGDTREIIAADDRAVVCNANQHANPWTPGGDNEVRISYKGATTTLNVTILPGRVTGISVEDVTVTEGTGGSCTRYETANGTDYAYNYEYYPERITVYLSDGDPVTGTQYEIWEALGVNIQFEPEQPQSYHNQWGVGEHKVTASLNGKKAEYHIIVEESNIASVTVEDVELEEKNGGYWRSEDWDPNTGMMIQGDWYYYAPENYAQITVTFHDDTPTFTGTVSDFIDQYNIHPQIPTNQGYYNQWRAGQIHNLKLFLGGELAEFTATIIEPNITKIEVIDTQDFAYFENDTSCGRWEGESFYYNAFELARRLTIRVTYKDETTEDICFIGENGMPSGIDYRDNQHETPWTVGGENLLTIIYGGVETTISAAIEESPIESIVVDNITHTQYTGGSWENGSHYDEFGNWIEAGQFYRYSESPNRITITYTGGRVVSGNPDEIFQQTGVSVQCHSEQSWQNQWGVGVHTATLSFMGKTVEYTVTITESDIVGVTAFNLTVMEGTGGQWNPYTDADGEMGHYYYYNFMSHDITIHYKDGESFTGNYEEIYQQTGYYPEFITTQSIETPWGVGTHTVTVGFLGATGTFDVTITPTNVTGISVQPITILEHTDGEWRTYYDENGEHEYYFYYIYDLGEITITYDDETTLTGTRDDIREQTGIEITTLLYQDFDKPWGLGTQYITVAYAGVSVVVPVEIKASPIASITVDEVILEAGKDGSWDNYNGEEYYFYHIAPQKITINYTEGESWTGTYDELRELLEDQDIYFSHNQPEFHWGIGTHIATFYCMGKTVEYTVTIIPSRIESITVLPVVQVAGKDGWEHNEYYDPQQDAWIEGHWWEYKAEFEIIRVTFTDGTVFTGTRDDFQRLGYEFRVVHDQSYNNQWTTGVHPVTLILGTFETTYNVEVVEEIQADQYTYAVLSDGTAILLQYLGDDVHVVIPETIDGYTVRVLGNNMIEGTNVQAITVPATVDVIEEYAFTWNFSLTKLYVYAGVEIIGWNVTTNCPSLEKVIFYGTEEQANEIAIFEGNESLVNAQWYYITECVEHTYDDVCDGECNVCFATREPEHSYEWVIDDAGNCVNDGFKHEACALCEATRNWGTLIPADGIHDHTELIDVREATCVQSGYTGDLYCYDCNQTIEFGQYIEPTEHKDTYLQNASEPTCVGYGYTGDVYCPHCCAVVQWGEGIPPTGHLNTERINVREATCGEQGYTGDIFCNDCEQIIEYGETVDAKNHANTLLTNIREATCGQTGYTGDTYCVDCEEIVAYGETLPTTEHLNTRLINVLEATCGEDGYTGDIYCDDCGNIPVSGEVIPATGNHGALTVTNAYEATCNQPGYTGDVFCKDCQKVVAGGQEIPATGKHTYDNGYDADCNECGAIREITMEAAKLTMGSVTGYQGETLRVDVSIENNTGFAGLQFGVLFDNTYLTLKNVETQMEGFHVTVGNSVVFDSLANYTADGVIATLIFEVAEDAPIGEYNVQLRFMSGSTDSFEAVVMTDAAATIKVESAVAGDANGDGRVDTVDLIMLRQHLAFMDPITKVSEIAVKKGADYNTDGVIDALDLAHLRQHLASMPVS